MAEDLYSAILNSAARNAARQEMDTTALDRLAMEQQLARLLAGQRRRERQAEIWPGGTFTLVEPEKRPTNALYELLSNARLNQGLETLAGNTAEVIFGEPSGNDLIDYGVSNIPGVGAVAIGAGGGQPGLVDILGGLGGALKGMAVVAKPLASRIIRNASYTTGQDLGMDAARNVARNVIDRMARIQGDVTGDEIYPFIKEEMQNLGLVGARDEARIKELATGFAEDTYLRALEDLEAGKTPRLNLVLPEKENIAYKPLYEGMEVADDELRMGEPADINDFIRARERAHFKKYRARNREERQLLTDDEWEEIERRANERFQREYSPERYSQKPGAVLSDMKRTALSNYLAEKRKAAMGVPEFSDLSGMGLSDNSKKIVSDAAADAYRKAVDEALSAGYDHKTAQQLASLAGKRARYAALKSDAKAWEEDKKRRLAGNANKKIVFNKLHPSIKEEIAAGMKEAGENAKQQAIALGTPSLQANHIASNARHTFKNARMLEILKELGFKNANDPRLQNYEVIGRTPEESVMKAVADDIFGE